MSLLTRRLDIYRKIASTAPRLYHKEGIIEALNDDGIEPNRNM